MRKECDKVEHYVVFDFETTGFSPQKNEIIQIGAVKYDQSHQEIARFNQLNWLEFGRLPYWGNQF